MEASFSPVPELTLPATLAAFTLQRIHDPALLTERAEALGLPVETIQSYLDSFKCAAGGA